jgi:hypothetical protein
MTNQHQDRAVKVVEAFRGLLDENINQQIADAKFDTLTLMITEAISEELGVAADMMEDVVKKVRAEINKPELGM